MTTTVDDLLANPPLVHRVGETALTHGLVPPALRFIEQTVKPGWRTLETGSGLSTIVFALLGAEHTTVVPAPEEVERIKAWCADQGVDTSRMTFHTKPSERVLPGAELGELDLVLIDGSHSFPHAFVDWFYTHSALKVGGWMIIDDIHVWTGKVLRDFLVAEPEWSLEHTWWGRTIAVRKVAETDPEKDWLEQPYVTKKTNWGGLGRARIAAGMVRGGEWDELRKRARSAIGR